MLKLSPTNNAGMTTRYRRVPQSEDPSSIGEEKRRAERIENITEKVHAAFWVGISGLILYYTDLINKALYGDKLDRFSLNLGCICLVTNVCLMIYASVYLPYVQTTPIPINLYSPRLVPIATALGVLCIVCFMCALWPLYGLLSPLLILIFTFGLLFSTHFIPWPF